jgi:hypothetical protein
LSVADGTEAAEELASDLAHFWPRRLGVNFFHYSAKGTAAADGDAEIVDGVGIGRVLQAFELFPDAVHPVGEAAVLRF